MLFLFFILITIIISFYLPSLLLPWSLIDDGQILTNLRSQKLSNLFFIDKNLGRLRPSYWLFHKFKYKLFGTSVFAHHAFQLLILLVTIVLLFKFFKNFKNKYFATLSILLTFIFPGTVINFWRLGTQETLLVLWLVLSLWFAYKNKLWPALLSSFLLFTSKETSFYLLPVFLMAAVLIKDKLTKKQSIYLIFNLVASSILLLLSFALTQKGYAANTTFNLGLILNTFKKNLIHLLNSGHLFLLAISGILIFKDYFKNKTIPPLVILNFIAAFSYLILHSFWPHSLLRYLFPVVLHLSIIIAFYLLQACRQGSLLTKLIWVPFIIFSLFYSSLNSFIFVSGYFAREKANSEMISTLARYSNNQTTIYFNFNRDINAQEWFKETGQHLDLFYDLSPQAYYIWQKNPQGKENEMIIIWNKFQHLDSKKLSKYTKNKEKVSIFRSSPIINQGLISFLKAVFNNNLENQQIIGQRQITWTIYF